jgi:photosystem II stability/assembly factor-like uncharacterized protein
MEFLTQGLKRILLLLGVIVFCVGCSKVPSLSYNPWQLVQLPNEVNLQDITFTDDQLHGWLVGSGGAIFETTDGGQTWKEKQLALEEVNPLLRSVSFKDREGWIVGEPSIVLHSTDGGQSWSRIPLSAKLPGVPSNIVALGPNSAEMATNVGAIYQTSDGGKTWKALVQEAVGMVRNISRSTDGQYVAVSSRGNFYSTWAPGQDAWVPHNRNSSRRVQNMGFSPDGKLWMLARGGQIQFTTPEDRESWEDPIYPEFSTSWGLLDMAYRTPDEVWVTGGGGQLLLSADGGQTWQKDRDVENVPSNFNKIVFLSPQKGFIIGQRGILLRYQEPAETA